MDFDGIENLNEEQILELYQEIIETPSNILTYVPCPGDEGKYSGAPNYSSYYRVCSGSYCYYVCK